MGNAASRKRSTYDISMASVILHISIGGVYVPLLSIPLGDCHRFALAPLRWLRFLGYCIYGSPGSISATAGGPPVAYLSAIQGGDYYFTSPGIQIHSLWRLIFAHLLSSGSSVPGR